MSFKEAEHNGGAVAGPKKVDGRIDQWSDFDLRRAPISNIECIHLKSMFFTGLATPLAPHRFASDEAGMPAQPTSQHHALKSCGHFCQINEDGLSDVVG
jgi:hypothetical protein